MILAPLARIWDWAGGWKRTRDIRARRRLDIPVISVGNITAGGTGKTPFVIYLAEQMRQAGHRTGIVTRGYRRQSHEKHLILEAGANASSAETGDEPQIFLRRAIAPVGIGADRFETGRILAERFHLNALVLDDGFQHMRLERRLDVVLIDSLDPFGGDAQLPLGRLREPLASLSRADVFVLTRSDCGRAFPAIERRLRQYNTRAPIFRARVVAEHWIKCDSGNSVPPQEFAGARVAAFCGLGNPQSFWNTLSGLGIHLIDRITFRDHHRYPPEEIRAMAQRFAAARARVVLTTEKDAINLGEAGAKLIAPLELYWLRIGCQVDREAELLAAIESCFS
jgi:tetraacyldisaccharide 4'-kinase